MSYKIISKYIKSVAFNIPSPNTFFSLAKEISNYKINIEIKSNQFKNNLIEVETSMSLIPNQNNPENINAKIIYSSIVELPNEIKDKKVLKEIILIQVPNDIYSDLRKSFIFLFESSGFKDVKIEKTVDFKKLYEKKIN